MAGPIITDAAFLGAATEVAGLPAPAYAEVAFAGRSNVGKSSLINSLLGRRKLVRTSSTPGCTRAIGLFRVRLKSASEDNSGATFDLADLPGYGYAQRSKAERKSWGPMIESFLRERAGLRAVVVIIDIRRGMQDEDLQLIEFLDTLELNAILVATKIDKLPRNKRKPALAAIQKASGLKPLGYSSEDGEGREQLWKRLLPALAIRPALV